MADRLNATLQENILTLLAYDPDKGKVISSLIDPKLFEGDLRVIAERVVEYWKRYGLPPKAHLADLVADIIDDPHHLRKATYERIIRSIIDLSDSVNGDYVLDQVMSFTRLQKLKSAILHSADELNAKQELGIVEVEAIWSRMLHTQETSFDPGMRLTEIEAVLDYLNRREEEFITGIGPLDARRVVPSRESVMLLIAPTGKGKSWFLIHIGKLALAQRKRVLHISLEMSTPQVIQRYYQSLFSVAKRVEKISVSTLNLNDKGGLDELGTLSVSPDFSLSSPNIRDELTERLAWREGQYEKLVVKRFPTRGLTIDGLRGYLDNLEISGFIPDLILLDYIGIMKTEKGQERWVAIGQNFEEFRGMCVERHCAGVTVHQTTRGGSKARSVGLTDVAGDWSLTNTADVVLTYTQTDLEKRYGLGRLYVGKVRDEEDRFGVLMTQNYRIGQFCMDAMILPDDYYDTLDKWRQEDTGHDDEESENEDD